jgi:aminoglycoside 6'-N-acetyltransferase
MDTITGRLVRLRLVTPADVPRLREILGDPAVARWWGEQEDDLHDIVEPEEGETSYAIDLLDGGDTVGLIQSWEEPTPQYRHAGIDIAVHPDFHGRGIGTDAVVALARHLVDVRGHHRITIDPAVENERAIAVYRRVGFRDVGVMRRYERAPDGNWRDGLLMDLLPDELTLPPREP